MSTFKENGFLKSIFSLWQSKEQVNEEIYVNDKESENIILVEKPKGKKRIWKKDCSPIRSVVLWGRDNDNNPSFLILYGEHKFKSTEDDGEPINRVLEDNVKYTSYAVFKGKEGHFPAFQAVKIIDEGGYHNRRGNNLPKMYYKTGIKSYWKRDENYTVQEFVILKSEEQIILPYFKFSYKECIEKIEEQGINFQDFILAKHPNEILELSEDFLEYYQLIYDLVSNENLYSRKKRLNELLDMKPSKAMYEYLIKIGSTEHVSGLFLELAKRKDSILVEEAKIIYESEIHWGEESYIKGVKRCARIYISTLDDKLKEDRAKSICESLPYMDLHLIRIKDSNILEGKIIEGATYRKYANQGLLREYQGRYDYSKRKWIEQRCSQRYKISNYSDGVILNTLELKNTIQEAEAYGLADVIGKIAYYLDSPRLTYYFRGNDKTKELKYYKRYIQKIIDFYGQNDPERFMQAMKSLLTSYTKYDYVCKFRGNFQFNEILKHYLYYEFKDKPPVGWENWEARSRWMENDQLMKLQGRYEFMKKIWDNHLEDVLDIASKAKIDPILKACYYILKDSKNTKQFVNNMPYTKLVKLTEGSYEPLANIFRQLLSEKLKSVGIFKSEIMFALMNSCKKENHDLARDYMNKTNGAFSASDLVVLIRMNNFEIWSEVFKENLLFLDASEYFNFVKAIIKNSEKFISVNFSKEIKDILSFSTSKIQKVSESEKVNLLENMIYEICNANKISDWIHEFVEEVIFSVSYEELDALLKKAKIRQVTKAISQRSRQVISILETIQNKKLPSDSDFIGILETGTSKMITVLFTAITESNEELSLRFSTLLIMLESDITILNKKAEEIFDNMTEEKRRKLHAMIIDSPVNKVYSFGIRKLDEIYKELIPKEIIIQMLEHTSSEVKAYISNKTNEILNNLGNGDKELFIYYIRTLLFLPNKISRSKDNLYEAIPKFVLKYIDKREEVEDILLDIGGSNIIKDSERALTTLAQIRKGVVLIEG
ncbi:hypothetical protein D2A34_00895 [Clostridium chromiireducens]|uniref:Uncharacterized protein n=1 Tax=Clostridium chromiireducens TaxID=225345 RepID=A0A399ISE4_9CLOT|nr:hypothetical protein [Clostridium chromiireducens]RII35958.1 hypothetical protein D2A34_00895 [Clostridium chromiireducens]